MHQPRPSACACIWFDDVTRRPSPGHMRPRLRLKQRALRLRMARKNIHVACTRSPSPAPFLNPPSCPCPPPCSTSTSSSACRGPPPPATAKVQPPPTASFFFKTQLQVTVFCTRCIRPCSNQLLCPHSHGLLHHRLHLHRALPPRSPPHPNQTLFLFSHRKLPPPHVSTSPRPSHHPPHRAHAALAEHSPASPVQCLPSCSGLSECRPPPPLHHPVSIPHLQPCRPQLGVAFNGVCTIGKVGGEPPTGDLAAFQILEYGAACLFK